MRSHRDAPLGLLAAAILVVVTAIATGTPVAAQTSSPPSNLPPIGLCQCIADRTSLHEFCTAGPARCQQTCGSPRFAFVPLTGQVLRRCSLDELFVVLPNADGRPGSGAITVTRDSNNTLLDQPYAAAGVIDGATASVPLAPDEVETMFGSTIRARPSRR